MIDSVWQKARPYVDSLGIRLAIVLAIGLLPLMIVSIQRSQSVVSEAVARSQAALVGETLQAVRQETILIEKSKSVALSLGQLIVPLLRDLETCNEKLDQIVREAAFSFIGFADVTGYVPCSSADDDFRYKPSKNFREQLNDPRPEVHINLESPTLRTSAVFASHPVFSDEGALLGFVRVTFPHSQLRNSQSEQDSDATFLTLKADRSILTASTDLDDASALLPKLQAEESIADLPLSFEREAIDGTKRLYAVVPVVEGELYALATWPKSAELSKFYLENPALFPALMWLASLTVAWFATSLFVTKDITNLRRSMREFAINRRLTDASDFHNAPSELQDLADSFHRMTESIVQDEAQLEDAVRQKDVLLREVHHRVKNNLQLVSSIMALQMHQTKSPEVEKLMRNLQDRVNSIATVHHSLYQTSGQADVAMAELLETIVRQVVRVGGSKDHALQVKTNIEPLHFNPDQAVPLSLFLTEALTNSMKYIGNLDDATISVSLEEHGSRRARLLVENSVGKDDDAHSAQLTSTGLGAELMGAFAEQLGGQATMRRVGDTYEVAVDFPIEDLAAKDL